MKLTMPERYILQELLPVQESFHTLRIIRDLQERLSPSEEELKKYNITVIVDNIGQRQLVWDNKKVNLCSLEFEIEIGEILTNIIVEILKEKNKNKQLQMREYTLYEKFVEGK